MVLANAGIGRCCICHRTNNAANYLRIATRAATVVDEVVACDLGNVFRRIVVDHVRGERLTNGPDSCGSGMSIGAKTPSANRTLLVPVFLVPSVRFELTLHGF